jgi:hypothetical protein
MTQVVNALRAAPPNPTPTRLVLSLGPARFRSPSSSPVLVKIYMVVDQGVWKVVVASAIVLLACSSLPLIMPLPTCFFCPRSQLHVFIIHSFSPPSGPQAQSTFIPIPAYSRPRPREASATTPTPIAPAATVSLPNDMRAGAPDRLKTLSSWTKDRLRVCIV